MSICRAVTREYRVRYGEEGGRKRIEGKGRRTEGSAKWKEVRNGEGTVVLSLRRVALPSRRR